MVDRIHETSDLLPRSFYQQPALEHDPKAAYETYLNESSVSRSAMEVAHDPANISAALYLPLLSFDDYQAFLLNGQAWFDNPDKAVTQSRKETEEKYREIILSVLDGWHDALEKDKEQKKRKRPSPLQQLIDYEYKRLAHGHGMSAGEMSVRTGTLINIISQIGYGSNGEGVHSFPGISGAWNVVKSQVSPRMASDLGMAAAYYTEMVSVQNAYLGPSISKAIASGLGYLPPRQARASSYAVLMVREIFSERFDQYMDGFIRSCGGKARTMSSEQMLQIITMMRIVLLTTSLALVYKSETGGMTSIEIGDMLRGKMTVENETIKSALVTMVRTQLSIIPPKQRALLIESILEYIDGNPSTEELTRPSEVLDGILGTSTMEHVLRQAG